MYTIYYPSNRLFLDDVLVDQTPGNPTYDAYLAWVLMGNGPDFVADPVIFTPSTASIARIATAMERLGITTPTADQMNNQVFPLAATL